jgi:hypothetical protein
VTFLSFEAHVTYVQVLPYLPSPRPPSPSGNYDALDGSRHGCHIATGQSRHNHSPYSEPTVLIAPYASISIAPRPCSSSAALDRGGLLAPQVSRHGWKSFLSCILSREPSPGSRASLSPSVTNSPNIRSHLQSIMVPPSHHSHASTAASAGAITSASCARLSSQMISFINSTPGDTQDAPVHVWAVSPATWKELVESPQVQCTETSS